jgi:hypothetical protein
MGVSRPAVFFALLLMPALALAQGHAVVTPTQLVWKPLIPGVEMAVVSDDSGKTGLYVIRIRTKGEVRVPPTGIRPTSTSPWWPARS